MTRRSRRRRSAGGCGFSPRPSQPAARKASMALPPSGRDSAAAGTGGAGRRAEGPVVARVGLGPLVGRGRGALVDPSPQKGDLRGGQPFPLARWRHPPVRFAGDAADQRALAGRAGHDGRAVVAARQERPRRVGAEAALRLQGPVAGETPGRQHGLDLAEVVDPILGGGRGTEEQARQDRRRDANRSHGGHPPRRSNRSAQGGGARGGGSADDCRPSIGNCPESGSSGALPGPPRSNFPCKGGTMSKMRDIRHGGRRFNPI